jgi:hypothetical protein
MPIRRSTKPNRSLVDARRFQRVPPSTVSRLLDDGLRRRMGLVSEGPDALPPDEDLWGGFIFALFAVEGLCGDQDLRALLDLRMKDLAGLDAGQWAWRREGSVWWVDLSWQTRLEGLLYRAFLARRGARVDEALILPASLTAPGAEVTPEQAFRRWLKRRMKAVGLPALSLRDVREAARLWQVRHRRGYVAAARQGIFLFDPPAPPRSAAELCAFNAIVLPETGVVLEALAAVTTKGGALWQPGLPLQT